MPKKPPDAKYKDVAGEPTPFRDVRKRIAGVKFLVDGWIPKAALTQIVALSGVGKSSFVLHGVARPFMTARGEYFSGQAAPREKGRVLYCDTEARAALMKDRLREWRIDDANLFWPWEPVGTLIPGISLDDDRDLLRVEYLCKCEGIGLVIVDSLTGAHCQDENSARIGTRLQALAEIAQVSRASVAIVHHAHKASDPANIIASDSRGSGAIYSYCLAQLGIDKPDPQSDWCRVKVMKENLGLAPPEIGFRIHAAGIEYGTAPSAPKKRGTKADVIAEWIADYMGYDQWIAAEKVYEQTDKKGWSRNAVQRARESLGITEATGNVERREGRWWWRLPSQETTDAES